MAGFLNGRANIGDPTDPYYSLAEERSENKEESEDGEESEDEEELEDDEDGDNESSNEDGEGKK